MKTRTKLLLAAGGAYWAWRMWLDYSRSMDFGEKVVVITGGSRGLGLILAREFGRRGSKVAICARDAQELERAQADLSRRNIPVMTQVCDISVKEEADRFIGRVEAEWGSVDILVNNAGVIQDGPMEEMTIADYEEAMKIHFWAPLYATLAAIPGMKRRAFGRIVNIASIGGKVSVPHLLPYCASKFALVGLSEGLRAELVKDDILVTTVCPGLMRTGSPVTATFKGRKEEEYAYFVTLDTMPGVSIQAERAAQRIVNACEKGQAECIIGLPAQVAARVAPVFPGLTAEILAKVNERLPGPGGIGAEVAPGQESEAAAPSEANQRAHEAAAKNNE